MSVVIQCVSMPFWWTPQHPNLPDVTGHYLKSYDPGADSGAGWEWTPSLSDAKPFATYGDAHRAWTAVNPNMPKRPTDGRPNRPLTMYSVMVVPAEEATDG